jgi:hypothetical protein
MRVRSHGPALDVLRCVWLVVALALVSVGIIDVDGDPTTSNTTSGFTTDLWGVDAATVEALRRPGISIAPARGRPRSIFRHLTRVRSLVAPRTPSIRGP